MLDFASMGQPSHPSSFFLLSSLIFMHVGVQATVPSYPQPQNEACNTQDVPAISLGLMQRKTNIQSNMLLKPVKKDNGMSDDDAKMQVASNRNSISMQIATGCSGSSFVYAQLNKMLQAHGYAMLQPYKEMLVDKTQTRPWKTKYPYCTESDGTQHYWPHDGLARVEAAWSVLNGSIHCQKTQVHSPRMLFFDGHSSHHMKQVLPFLGSLGPQQVHVHGMVRANALERAICQVKDCFEAELGYPVNATGHRSDLCFKRRKKITEGNDNVYKVHLEIRPLLKYLENYQPPWKYVQHELEEQGFHQFPTATFEELTAYEYQNSTKVFKESARIWAKLINGMGITANDTIVESTLASGIGSRTPHVLADEIYNFEEVKEALRKWMPSNTEYHASFLKDFV